jgi:hypothetical protein
MCRVSSFNPVIPVLFVPIVVALPPAKIQAQLETTS